MERVRNTHEMTAALPRGHSGRTRTAGAIRDVAPLLAVIAAGLFLRATQIHESLWVDELHTSWVVSGSAGDVAQRASLGNHSSAYFWLPWATTRLFGLNEFGLRLPSLLGSAALMTALYAVASRWSGSKAAGLMAASLAAVDPTSLFYGTEARAYAWIQALTVVHVGLFEARAVRPTIRNRIGVVALGALLVYLHYTSALLFLAEGVWFAGWCLYDVLRRPNGASRQHRIEARSNEPPREHNSNRRRRDEHEPRDGSLDRRMPTERSTSQQEQSEHVHSAVRRFAGVVLDAMLLALALLPAWGPIWEIASRREVWSQVTASPATGDVWRIGRLDLYVLPLFFLLAATALIRRLPPTARRRESTLAPSLATESQTAWANMRAESSIVVAARFRRLSLIAAWYTAPVLAAWIATQCEWAALFAVRYLSGALVAPLAAAGILCAMIPSRVVRWASIMAIVAATVHAAGYVAQWNEDGRWIGDRREDWRGAIQWIDESMSDEPAVRAFPVIVYAGLVDAEDHRAAGRPQSVEYSAFPILGAYRLSDNTSKPFGWTSIREGLDHESVDAAIDADGAWLVMRLDRQHADRWSREFARQMELAGHSVSPHERRAFGHVTVARFKVETDSAR